MSNETRERLIEAGKVAALVALTRHGVTPDVGEMLTHGDGRLVPPNAINAMMTAALDAILSAIMEPDEAMIEAGKSVTAVEASTGRDMYLDTVSVVEAYKSMIRKLMGGEAGL